MKLSIVTTLYKSAQYVDEFYERTRREIEKITDDYQIIFVDDGSPDESLQRAISVHEHDKNVCVIELSKNFGHHKAIMTGLRYAEGDYVFLIEVDLEEEPELLSVFWKRLQEDNTVDVLYAVQENRRGGVIEKISGEIFYTIASHLSNTPITKNMTNCRLMTKKYCQELIKFREKDPYLAGIFSATGFNQKPVLITKHSTSETTYTLRKKIAIVESFFTSFTYLPLYIIFYFGLAVSLILLLLNVFGLLKYLFNSPLRDSAYIMLSIWLLGGTILLSVGVVGIYLSKLMTESKQTPYVVIKKLYGNFHKTSDGSFFHP